jgi:hypothetical protein
MARSVTWPIFASFCEFLVQAIQIQRLIIDDQNSVGHEQGEF